jgi:hypothetical protein
MMLTDIDEAGAFRREQKRGLARAHHYRKRESRQLAL